jgi:hypothetical protein
MDSASAPALWPKAMLARRMGSCWRIVAMCTLALAAVIPARTASAEYQYVKLGNGGCRTPQGTMGNYITVENISFDRCRAYCDEAPQHQKRCYGIEYHRQRHTCELHTKAVASATGSGPSVCYQAISEPTYCPKCD